MSVLVTGAYGRVGTSLIEHTSDEFEYNYFDQQGHSDHETYVGNVSDYEGLSDAIKSNNSVVHLAAEPQVDADWPSVLENNIIGSHNCIKACKENEVASLVLASTNHVMGMYEQEHAPELYKRQYDLLLNHCTPPRPDSYYASSKLFMEALGRYYVENYEFPKQVYVLRFGSVRFPEYDHPFGDAERGVENGDWLRGNKEYQRSVRRMKATWQSRSDAAQLIECCLTDTSVEFDVFYGVSDNDRRWFDLERARAILGYRPEDNGENWEAPSKSSIE